MIAENNVERVDWFSRANKLLQEASTPYGIKASLTDISNYSAVFTRDAVMAGIVGILLQDDIIIEGLKNTLLNLKKIQGPQGQIASNYTIKDDAIDKVSYGTLSPKIDSCTWYLIGVGFMVNYGFIDKGEYAESVFKTINLLEGLEYNGKHLLYIPKGGNWADEYVFEGYVLYDQVLRAWGLSLHADIYSQADWDSKSKKILNILNDKYLNDENFYNASFYPGGEFSKYDLAAHALVSIIGEKNNTALDKALDWTIDNFVSKDKFPPAFYPVISESDPDWDILRKYHLFDFKNKPHHYHNGGIWWIWLGWLSIAYSVRGKSEALNNLVNKAFNYLDENQEFNFEEYIAADSLTTHGTTQLCYTAAGICMMHLAKSGFDFTSFKLENDLLIYEQLNIKAEYFDISKSLYSILENKNLLSNDKLVIGVCGESGSGKSVTSKCLQIELEKAGISSKILHMDSYFKLAPNDNHERRKKDISFVGPQEVNLGLLKEHIDKFRNGATSISVPVVDYLNNSFTEINTKIADTQILIIEGVYAFHLTDLDFRIYLERTYKESLQKRRERSREVYDPFVEEVLEIEQSLVLPLRLIADVTITNDYQLKK